MKRGIRILETLFIAEFQGHCIFVAISQLTNLTKKRIMSDSSNRNNRIIIIVLLIALVAAVAGLYIQKQNNDTVVTDLTEEKNALIVDLDELAAQYEALILENDSANEELVAERARIIALRDSVATLQADVARLTRYRNEVYTLKKEKAVNKTKRMIVMVLMVVIQMLARQKG